MHAFKIVVLGARLLGIMDPLFMANSLFRRRRLEECVKVCTDILEKNPRDQAAWSLKLRALTEQTYIDEVEYDEEGMAEMLMDENAIADVARPGTSLARPMTGSTTSQGIRPLSQAGRPISGFARPGTQSGRPSTMEQALKTPRTAQTARPVTSASGRYTRLGTASMITEPGGPFIDVSKLDFMRYAGRPSLAKPLFMYLFHHENDVKNALALAAAATEVAKFNDWWWKVQLGKCYFRLGLLRDAEKQFKSALGNGQFVDIYLFLAKVYVKLDQPLTALDVLKKGLEKFPGNAHLLTGVARIQEALGNQEESVNHYKLVLLTDNTSIEAIASLATHHFYDDQPEIALKLYRRLLQMGVYNAELFVNLGLCSFYAQQYDVTINCFQRALSLASDDNMANVWYNIGHFALGLGDNILAYQCFKLAVTNDNNHAEAYNNLGVLEWHNERKEQAISCFNASKGLSPHCYEPHYNTAVVTERIGDIQTSYQSVKKSLEIFPEHLDSKELFKRIREQFEAI